MAKKYHIVDIRVEIKANTFAKVYEIVEKTFKNGKIFRLIDYKIISSGRK